MIDRLEAYQSAVANALQAIDEMGDQGVDDPFIEKILSFKSLLIRQNVSAYLPIYRARVIESGSESGLTKSYGSPPSEKCTSDGRAHIAGHPVFYGAVDQDTAIKEVLRTLDNNHDVKTVYVSKWWATREYNVVEFLYDDEVLKSEIAQTVNSRSLAKAQQILADYPESGADLLTICRFVSKHFLDPDHRLSSRLAYSILYTEQGAISEHVELNGIWYPSVVKEHAGFNVAFTPQFVKEHMSLRMVYEYRVKGNTRNGVHVAVQGVGMVDGGREEVLWFDVAHTKPTFQNIMCVVDGNLRIAVAESSVFSIEDRPVDATTVLKSFFKPVEDDLSSHIGTMDIDIAPGAMITRPFHVVTSRPLHLMHEGHQYAVKSINAEVVLRPRLTRRK